MRRVTRSQFLRLSPYAMLAAAVAFGAGFALSWSLTAQPAGGPSPVAAVVRQRLVDTGRAETYERQYNAAHAEVNAAAEAVEQARQRLDTALFHARGAAAPAEMPAPRPHSAVADYPTTSYSSMPADEDALLLRQRLIDLEARRQTLAERLMPEHPEMKAIDEKIEALRASLAGAPAEQIEHLPVVSDDEESPFPTLAPEQIGVAAVRQLGQALLAAQQRYKNALSRERACWEALAAARGQMVAEVEPATASRPGQDGFSGYRWLFSLMTGVVFGGLVTAIWPSPRRTFASVDEVRAFTRLPVVVIERAALN